VNWKGFLTRILLIVIAFPILGVLVFLPQLNHLAFNIAVIAVTVVGAFEMDALFRARGVHTYRWLVPLLAGAVPLAAYLEVAAVLPAGSMVLAMAAAFAVVFIRATAGASAPNIPMILSQISASAFTLLYPGFFMSYVVRLSCLPQPTLNILFFLCIVFGNDMSAYFAGSLWGQSTRLNLAVSPQKSIVGFAAGLAGSLIIVLIFHFAAPGYPPFGLPLNLTAGLALGVLTILGDLIESGFKRSAGVKDSGVLILGRGGILDSVDSMLLSAPLFYYLLAMASR
jgi:phosphatidate cytidylyltransferase